MENLKTGDLILFSNNSNTSYWRYLSDIIKYFTHSDYTHIAMVLKDPTFIREDLKGLYIWESSWEGVPDSENHELKMGVQIQPLNEILNKYKDETIVVRKINCPSETFNDNTMREIHEVVHDKPYDIYPKDWMNALFKKDTDPQKTSRFWCSALVGYIYTKAGILNESTDWSILTPGDYSLGGENLSFNTDCNLLPYEEKNLINKIIASGSYHYIWFYCSIII